MTNPEKEKTLAESLRHKGGECAACPDLSRRPFEVRIVFFAISALITVLLSTRAVEAQTRVRNQISAPDSKMLFQEEHRKAKKAKKEARRQALETEAAPTSQVDFQAGKVEFQKDSSTITGSEGVIISGLGVQVQAGQGRMNTESHDTEVSGNVVISDSQGVIDAGSADYNIESELGKFKDARFSFEETGFRVSTREFERLSEDEYSLKESLFSTCECENGALPWAFGIPSCNVTREGYAWASGANFQIMGVPVFYTPIMGFPAKTERASGLLSPTVGYSSENGLLYRQPVFVDINESTDLILEPFVQTSSRVGTFADYNQVFSKDSKLFSHFLYSNDSMRGDNLQGTDTSGIFDATPLETDRYGVAINQKWRNSAEDSTVPLSVNSSVQYISDNLLLRDIDDNGIASSDMPYTVSKILGQATLGDYGSAEISSEYDQSLTQPQDTTLERIPDAKVAFSRSFRPFGSNPYGMKLQTGMVGGLTYFNRQQDYDGLRTALTPTLGMPLHWKNYIYSQTDTQFNQAWYNMDETVNPGGNNFESSVNRGIGRVSQTFSTAVERVYDLGDDSLLSKMAAVGKENQDVKLVRVKHVIQPLVNYTYVPEATRNSEDIPLYDSLDRIRKRSLVTFGFGTDLLGRFAPRRGSTDAVTELMPRVEDLPSIGATSPIEDMSTLDEGLAFGSGLPARTGEIRELASFAVRESHDSFINESDGGENPWSDIGAILGLYPTRNFGVYMGTNYNPYESEIDSWSLSSSLKDDRGDALRLRYEYFRGVDAVSISQISGNLEAVLTESYRVGWFTMYDSEASEFIENYGAFRIISSCKCWSVDLGVRKTINPDKTSTFLAFTLGGLGRVSTNVWSNNSENNQ